MGYNSKKIYYKENGKRAKQLIKNFDISTKVYRRVEDDSAMIIRILLITVCFL